MFKRIFLSVFLTISIIFSALGSAHAAEWYVKKVTSRVMISLNGQNWTKLLKGARVPSHSWINTGKGGRVQLERGTETVWIKPNTMIGVFENLRGAVTKTTIMAQFGTMVADVRTLDKPHKAARLDKLSQSAF